MNNSSTLKLIKMKRLLFTAILIATALVGSSQLYVGFGLGTETQNKKPIYDLGIGVELNGATIEAQIRPTMTRQSNTNTYLGGKLGYNVLSRYERWKIVPMAGYFYNCISTDNKELNFTTYSASIKGVYMSKSIGSLYLEPMLLKNNVSIVVGISCYFK